MYTYDGDDMNIDDILPIGSIILLRRARKPLMIIGYFANVNENEKKDGLQEVLKTLEGITYKEWKILKDVIDLRGFNHKDIRSVIQIGNQGNSFLEFKDMLLNNDKIKEMLKEIK